MRRFFGLLVLIGLIFLIVTPNAHADLTTGLVAYYPFNGNANDESGNGNHGTVYGATLTNDRFGNADSAYSFDGVDDYVVTINNINISGNSARSISVWVSLDSFYEMRGVLGWGVAEDQYGDITKRLCFLRVSDKGEFLFHGHYQDLFTPENVISIGRWYHVVFTYDGTTGYLYVDGDLKSSGALELNTTNNQLKIGFDTTRSHYSWNRYWQGKVDDVRIYSRALSVSEIQQLYNTPFLNITYPNGGETLINGQDYTITWDSGNIIGDVQIDLYKGDTNVLQLAASAPNTGSYSFNPPQSLVDGSDYQIGISAEGGTVSDFSDSYFTITSTYGVLFFDDFNDGEASGWEEIDGNWAVENGEYSLYLNGNDLPGNSVVDLTGSANWKNYSYEIDVIRKEGVGTGLVFRRNQDGSEYYYVGFRTGWYWDMGQDYVFLCKNGGCDFSSQNLLSMTNYTFPLNEWHRIKIEVIDNNIRVYIKERDQASYTLLIDYTDNNNPHLYGKIGISEWSGGAGVAHNHYDNVIVTDGPFIFGTVLYNDFPLDNISLTLNGTTSKTTTTASDGTYSFLGLPDGVYTITPTSNDYTFSPTYRQATMIGGNITGQDFIASPNSSILFQDDFNDGDSIGWEEIDGNWAVENGEYSLYLNGNDLPGNSVVDLTGSANWKNYVFEIDIIRKEGVGTKLLFRRSDDGSKTYSIGFRTGWYWDYGQDYAFLNKDGTQLGVINYTFPLNIWHRIRIEAVDNNIKVYIKERDQESYNLLFDYTDTDNPYLYGKIGISEWSGGAGVAHNHYDNVIVTETSSGNSFITGIIAYNSSGLNNVIMTLSGTASSTTTTTSYGTYSFSGLSNGVYTITPSLTGYTFNPSSIDVTISDASVTGQDFRACDTSVPLSGILRDATTNTPLSGVTVTVDDTYSVITDANGYYEIAGLSCGTHTVTVDVPTDYSGYSRTMDTSLNATWDINLTKPETVKGADTNSGYGPDPVNTATGNYIYQKKDFKIPGRGLSFIFRRDYNSQDATDGPLGFGWGHTYNVTLTVNTDSTVTIRWGDGKTETWTPDGLGGYTPQYGVFDTLMDNGDGTYTLKKKDLSEYNFDTSGGLLSIVDKNGNTITLTYTGSNLTQITDTVGRNINFTYDGNNRSTLITDPVGRTLQFSYDVNGDLISAADMNGNTTTYTYDTNHQMLTVVDPRGNTVVTNVYDALKRVVTSQSDAKGGVTTYTYDEVNKKTTLVDQLGYTTIHYHDELLRLIQETDDSGNSAYYEYDSTGNRIKVTDKNGNETNYTYDSNGNVLAKTNALGNVTTITYDSNNNPLTRTDALGNVTTFEYDANGNLTKTTDPLGYFTTITYDPNGQPLTITDAMSGVTTNTYDSEGNLLSVTDALGNTTAYTYDGAGRRLTVTDALGRTTTYNYDDNDNLLSVTDPLGNVRSYTYDANNNKLSITDPLGNTANFSYDVKDLLTSVTDTLGGIVSYSYDGLDRRISTTDKNGNITNYSYDWAGNIVSITDALGNVTTYTYDANGNRLTETNPLGQTTTYTYDSLNRLVSVSDPFGNTTTNTYDALGRITATTNAKGQTTSFEYDALGRLTKVTDADGGIVTYTYDENGNRLTMTEPNGNTTSYTYDALNRLIQKVEPLGNTYQYAYDSVGNRISLTDAKGITINYTYDANNRLSVITYPDTSTVTFSYDANGNRIQMVDSLGTSTYAYDALNRMVSHTDPFGKTIGYGYDANGNRISLTYPDGKVVTYSYDALNRLSSVTDWLSNITAYTYDATGSLTNTLNPNNTTANYTYDAAGRLTGLSNEKSDAAVISSYSYTLDAIGNHTSTVKDEPLLPVLTRKNISYSYDAENRLTVAGSTTYSYDSNGNITSKGSDTYTYDYEDRLVQSNIGGVDSQYSYDGFGNRLSKTEGSATTRYVLDINRKLANVIAETDNTGTISAYYVYGLGLISKVLPDGTAYYYHYDSRGSTIALSDASENLIDTYAYDTFGNLANSQGTTVNPFKYAGRYGVMDEGNGLNFIRARYYSPEKGRFITKDPQTGNNRDGQSLNRYIYALNNPVILIDISGFSPFEGDITLDLSESSDWSNNYLFEDIDTSTAGSTPAVIEYQPIEYGGTAYKLTYVAEAAIATMKLGISIAVPGSGAVFLAIDMTPVVIQMMKGEGTARDAFTHAFFLGIGAAQLNMSAGAMENFAVDLFETYAPLYIDYQNDSN